MKDERLLFSFKFPFQKKQKKKHFKCILHSCCCLKTHLALPSHASNEEKPITIEACNYNNRLINVEQAAQLAKHMNKIKRIMAFRNFQKC